MPRNTDHAAIILVAGGHSSGKSTVCHALSKELQASSSLRKLVNIHLVNMNNYLFKPLTESQSASSTSYAKSIGQTQQQPSQVSLKSKAKPAIPSIITPSPPPSAANHSNNNEQTEQIKNKNKTIPLPSRFNFKKLREDLLNKDSVLYRQATKINDENSNTNGDNIATGNGNGETKYPIFLVHGLYALYDRELNKLALMKVFVDGDADTRLVRWVQRDTVENKLPLEEVIDQYMNYARPEFSEFIFPTKENADTILPRGAESIGISLICDGIVPLIAQRVKAAKRHTHNAHTIAKVIDNHSRPEKEICLAPYRDRDNTKEILSTTIVDNYRHSSNVGAAKANVNDNTNDSANVTVTGLDSAGSATPINVNESGSDGDDESSKEDQSKAAAADAAAATLENLGVSGLSKLNIKGEEFTDQRGRFYDLT